jgi:phage shock protein PspC (stress-responsive transcriptional regulator)
MVREGITVVMRAAIAGGRASGDTRCRRMQRRGYPMADRLVRPQQGKMIAGVCAGLSQRFGIDVTLLRILFVVFALVGAAEIIYIILWIVVPKE